jgi:uncharacterized protein YbbK (DUF523 family)
VSRRLPATFDDSEAVGYMAKARILISSCLLGECVRYDGGHARADSRQLSRWREEGRLVPICPEVAGGLDVPRPPVEIDGGDGAEVLAGRARVIDAAGGDATEEFRAGAQQALRAAREGGAELAILKDGSPSCGSSYIYDGSFAGVRRTGRGVTTALLEEHGVAVFSESEIRCAATRLAEIEAESPELKADLDDGSSSTVGRDRKPAAGGSQ